MVVAWQLVNSDLSTDKWIGLYDRLGTTEFPDSARRRWPEATVELSDIGARGDQLAERAFELIAPVPSGLVAHLQLSVRSDDSIHASVAGSGIPLEAEVLVWFRNLLGPQYAITFYRETEFRFLEVPYGLDVEGMLALMAEARADE